MQYISTHVHPSSRVNLHTHSWYCRHGEGELSDYIAMAKKLGFSALGFSEHCPLPDHRWEHSRMVFEQLHPYMQECRSLQSQETELQILCGFECDHHPQYQNWYKEELIENGFADYVVFGIHYLIGPDGKDTFLKKLPPTSRFLHAYTDMYIAALQSGMYSFGVHPDLFGSFYTEWDQEAISCSKAILSCASETGIPLEINGHGFRKPKIHSSQGKRYQYPLREFWELASSYDVPIIVNSDAHTPANLDISETGALKLANEFGLTLRDWRISTTAEAKRVLSIA
jgi:histidinol-phosphatase (PHP family)